MLVNNFIDFAQNIRWEYIFLFIPCILCVIQSIINYKIHKQAEEVERELKDIREANKALMDEIYRMLGIPRKS